jgi:hypothetical protein
MAQQMTDEQRLAILEAYNPAEHLISVGTNKDRSPVLYLPAAWRLYELRLRHPNFTLEAEIVHMDTETGLVIVKAIGYDGVDYASSNLKGTAFKQGRINELDKVETKAKSRVARDIGIGTEYALDMDADETDATHSTSNGTGTRQAQPQAKQSQPQPQQQAQQAQPTNITEQQLSSIRKLSEHLHKPVPDKVDTYSFVNARTLIQQLTAEYRTAKQQKAS